MSDIWIDALHIDIDGYQVRHYGRPVQLTTTEFRVLVALASNQGVVLSKPKLLELVWDYEFFAHNLVEVHISGLRRKLRAVGWNGIETVRSAGYVIRRPESLVWSA